MESYRIFLLEAFHVREILDIEADDDAEARALAVLAARDRELDIEIWEDNRLVLTNLKERAPDLGAILKKAESDNILC